MTNAQQSGVRARIAVRLLFAIAMSTICWSTSSAETRYTISGCVTDVGRRPLGGAKVLAWNIDGEHHRKGQTDKSTGCYELKHVPNGVYLMALEDKRIAILHYGPIQAKVRINSADATAVDLTMAVPVPKLLSDGVLRTVNTARNGFSSEKDTDVPMQSGWGDFGSGIPAAILSGFSKCVIHYPKIDAGSTAAEWCEIRNIAKQEEALGFYESMAQSIETVLTQASNLHFTGLREGEGGCAACKHQSEWYSPLNGSVSLRLLASHTEYDIQLWFVYNRRIAAQNCSAISKGVFVQSDPKAYQGELEKARSEAEAAITKELHVELRNVARLLFIGGPLEKAAIPVAVTEFPPADETTNCDKASATIASKSTTSAKALLHQNAERQTKVPSHVTLPDGTLVRLSLKKALSSATSQVQDTVDFKVTDDVTVNGLLVIPTGTPAVGHVLKDKKKKRLGKSGKLEFAIDYVELSSISRIKVSATSTRQGDSKTKKDVALSVLAPPLAPWLIFRKGTDATVPEGTIYGAYVDGNQDVPVVAVPGSATADTAQLSGATSSNSDPSPQPQNTATSVLNIISEPSGADISLDGDFVGNTPTTIPVPAGKHSVVVSKTGYKPWQRSLSVSAGGNITVDAGRLEKAQ